ISSSSKERRSTEEKCLRSRISTGLLKVACRKGLPRIGVYCFAHGGGKREDTGRQHQHSARLTRTARVCDSRRSKFIRFLQPTGARIDPCRHRLRKSRILRG